MGEESKVCPRCHEKGGYTIKTVAGIKYAYFVHYDKAKKSRKRFCYLGPVDTYKHAEFLLTLGLSGMTTFDHKVVLRNVIRKMITDGVRLNQRELKEYVSMLESLCMNKDK